MNEIDDFVRQELESKGKGAHQYDHTKRVYRLAMEIRDQAGGDLRILGAAALLHDVGRPKEKELGKSHAIISGEMSSPVLRRLGYSDKEIEEIVSAIKTHRFSEGLQPTSLEGRILSDADKLDAIGAIGVFRAIAQATETGVDMDGFLRHADEKLLRLKGLMHTKAASSMAEERHIVLRAFVDQLRIEVSKDL
ncbi:MAG: HD domain-containing protein [Candidatus Thorarchaeota archaeon]|jgi:uncharacterized protein